MTIPCPDWVDAAPFRHHVHSLICQTGLSWRLVAAHAGVAPRAVHALLHGRGGRPLQRIHVSIGRALAATSIESIREADTTRTDIRPVRDMVEALTRIGYRRDDLRRHLTEDDLDLLLAHGPDLACSDATRIRVLVCYDLLTGRQCRRRPRGTSRHPKPGRVDCSQHHALLDRKQPTLWATASSSPRNPPSMR